jgi:hypothetical protein
MNRRISKLAFTFIVALGAACSSSTTDADDGGGGGQGGAPATVTIQSVASGMGAASSGGGGAGEGGVSEGGASDGGAGGGGGAGDEVTCRACIADPEVPNNCAEHAQECIADDACQEWLQCAADCSDPECFQACDEQHPAGEPLERLYACICDPEKCLELCEDIVGCEG